MTDLLFVYGTLLQPGNNFAEYLNINCTYISAGRFKGNLYDLGEYPGAVITNNAEDYIYGSVFKLHTPEENLSVIDDYEGFGPEQHQPNLFIRSVINIDADIGLVNAWVYLYNLPVAGSALIASGNYAKYLRQKKIPR